MDQPWYLVGFGALLTVFGAAIALIGITNDTPELIPIGWGISSLAGLMLFVGLVALGVAIGVRAAERR